MGGKCVPFRPSSSAADSLASLAWQPEIERTLTLPLIFAGRGKRSAIGSLEVRTDANTLMPGEAILHSPAICVNGPTLLPGAEDQQ